MRHRDVVLPLLVVAGCNQVFGIGDTQLQDAPPALPDDAPPPPDRDRDGIPDEQDTCVNSIADGKLDIEGDAYTNEMDPCPFGYDDSDSDGDGIGNECDPFAALAGDRRRCVMAFANPTINREVWHVRDGTATWDLLSANGLTGRGTGALVATVPFEAPMTTTYVVPLALSAEVVGQPAAVTVWARTGDVASASDIGCEVRGDGTASTVRITGQSPQPIATPIQRLSEVQLSYEPGVVGRDTIRCRARFLVGGDLTVRAEVPLPAGRFGLTIENAYLRWYLIDVLERDDAPPL